MECTVHFFLLNDDFSIEHAEANFGGKESENNRRYEWEDELKITTDVVGIQEHDDASFPLQGELPNGQPFHHSVENMHMFELKGEVPTYVGCSKSLYQSHEVEEGDKLTLRIYMKDYEPLSNPIPGIYIAAQEFPKELVF